jgi:hypothetical protein
MSSDRDTELMRASAQHARQQALEIARDEYDNACKTWQEQIARGDSQGAAWTYQTIAEVVNRANVIAGAGQQPQQAQPQPQQQPGGMQLLPEDEEWIRNNQAVWNDPEKRAEIIKAANSLTVMHGLTGRYPRGSPQFYQAIEHWCGLKDASGEDALPIINDAEVARISKSKYGDVTPDEIQQGKERVALLKQYGLYPMGQS